MFAKKVNGEKGARLNYMGSAYCTSSNKQIDTLTRFNLAVSNGFEIMDVDVFDKIAHVGRLQLIGQWIASKIKLKFKKCAIIRSIWVMNYTLSF